MMSIVETCNKTTDKPAIVGGNKLRSSIHRFDQGEVRVGLLAGYSVSMNTRIQNWHPKPSTQPTERNREITKAFESGNITIQLKSKLHENDRDITFHLPKEKANYRVEISKFDKIPIDTKSTYSFDFKATSLPKSLLLFQVREMHGSMAALGGDRPSFSLHIKQDGTLVVTTNTVDQELVATDPNGKTYQRKDTKLKPIELDNYYHITIEMVMHRDHPLIKIFVDNEMVHQHDTPFGAVDSKTFYSKMGIYVAQQKNQEGSKDSIVSFDNIKEEHYQYIPSIITEENNICLNTLLPDAIAAFNTDKNALSNVESPDIEIHSILPEIITIAPTLLFV
jgi:hypothetical protein